MTFLYIYYSVEVQLLKNDQNFWEEIDNFSFISKRSEPEKSIYVMIFNDDVHFKQYKKRPAIGPSHLDYNLKNVLVFIYSVDRGLIQSKLPWRLCFVGARDTVAML